MYLCIFYELDCNMTTRELNNVDLDCKGPARTLNFFMPTPLKMSTTPANKIWSSAVIIIFFS